MTKPQTLSTKEAQDAYDSEVANFSAFAGKISELCKYVWAGALAIFYALATTDPTSAANKILAGQRSILFMAAIAGTLAFLFDYLQNISAYWHAARLAKWLEEQSGKAIAVDDFNSRTTSFFSHANAVFFFLKNLAVLLTALLIAFAVVGAFFKGS